MAKVDGVHRPRRAARRERCVTPGKTPLSGTTTPRCPREEMVSTKQKSLFEFGSRIHRSAEISECGRYRWWLRRSWTLRDDRWLRVPGRGVCCFVMLNPSTADAERDDPTIRRCIGFAKKWGYDTLSVRNLFPYRATNPKELLTASHVTGGTRGDVELLAAMTANLVVCAWGANVPFSRDKEALAMFDDQFPGVQLYCLGVTKQGFPRHPLYVKSDAVPLLFPGYGP